MALLLKYAFENALANKSEAPLVTPPLTTEPAPQPIAKAPLAVSKPAEDAPLKRAAAAPPRKGQGIDLKKFKKASKPIPIPKRTTYRYPHLRDRSPLTPQKKLRPETKVTFLAAPELNWQPVQGAADQLLQVDRAMGCRTGVATAAKRTDRELVIGIDLGTSSTKVVISDLALKQSYAVPFTDGAGVMSYLLPTLLIEQDGVYSLVGKGVQLNDLKLALMATPSDPVICARVVAYLGLVIQYARAWFFQNYRDQYIGAEILWCLALGQPADQVTSSASKSLFRQLGRAAWRVASDPGIVSAAGVQSDWNTRDAEQPDTDEFQCVVIPELAAQIHGYVSSTLFDPRRPNIFLLVDVGAGTLDASIFRVFKDGSGTTSFDLFTNSVEAYGVANLHRHRVNWWQRILASSTLGEQCSAALQQIKLPTEYRGFFPKAFSDYLKNVQVEFLDGEKNPDEAFFSLINSQLVGQIFTRAKNKKLLGPNDINGMPYFLCGGGARHSFYEQVRPALQKPPGTSWLNLTPRSLSVPGNLRADGVARHDYDRLSVAYGLSLLNLGTISRIGPMRSAAKVNVDHHSKWSDNYIDKDLC